MIGLPGQTVEILARDLELMKEMQIDMSGMGPFIPPRTNAAEKAYARQRFHDAENAGHSPFIHALASAARYNFAGYAPSSGTELALRAGANVIMPNVSPERIPQPISNLSRQAEYPRFHSGIPQKKITELIEAEGRTVATDFGHSMHPAFHQ